MSWLLLCSISVFYKVSVKTSLTNTEPLLPRGSTELGSFKLLVTFSSTSPHIILCYVCFCIKMPYLILLIHSYWIMAKQHYDLCLNEAYLMCVFPCKIHDILRVLRKTRNTSALCLQAVLNSKITKKKYNNTKKVTLNRRWKEHLFMVWQLIQDRASPFLSSVSSDSNFLLLCTCPKWSSKCLMYSFGGD